MGKHPSRERWQVVPAFWTLQPLVSSFLPLFLQQGTILEKLGICPMPKFARFIHDLGINKKDPKVKVTNLRFGSIPVRLFQPKAAAPGPRRGVIFYHGGGAVFGSLGKELPRAAGGKGLVSVSALPTSPLQASLESLGATITCGCPAWGSGHESTDGHAACIVYTHSRRTQAGQAALAGIPLFLSHSQRCLP